MTQRFFLLSELVRRDLASRFAGSFGGAAWAIANPLFLCVLYGLVFGAIIRVPPPPGFRGGYALFLLGGLLPWLGFQEAVVRGTTSVVDYAHVVKKVSFPIEILIGSSVVSALFLQAIGLVLLFGFVGVTGRSWPSVPLLAAAFGLEVLFLVGPVLALASLNVFFRDLPQILGPVLTVVFYLTPVIYPETMVPDRFRPLVALNPIGDLVALFRSALFGSPVPPVARLLGWAAAAVAAGAAGRMTFRRMRPSFADLL